MKRLISRALEPVAENLFAKYPIVTITGPRQSGKTTLCRKVFDQLPYANLEDLEVREFALKDPKGFLNKYPKGAVIDEIQRVPELTSYIQVLVDERQRNSLFVLSGSQNFSVREALSQSLAGRTAILTLLPFSISEIKPQIETWSIERILYTGFYPRIYDQQLEPYRALADYYGTYTERDLRQLSLVKNLTSFQTFVKLCAGRTGQLINYEKLGADAGVSQATAREWLSLLEASYIVFRMLPFNRNTRKRLVKSPKLYFYDVGLCSHLLGISNPKQLESHPLIGALFENLLVSDIKKYQLNHARSGDLYFYRDSDGNEIDVLVPVAQYHIPIEIKRGQTIQQDFFKCFSRFRKLEPGNPFSNLLIYGGQEVQERSDSIVSNIFSYQSHLESELNKLS